MLSDFLYEPAIKIEVVRNATIIPPVSGNGPGVFRSDGSLVALGIDDNECSKGFPAFPENDDVKELPEDVIYIGLVDSIWGFLLVDSVSRLWCVSQKSPAQKIAYTVSPGTSDLFGTHTARALELFSYLDLYREDFLKIEEPIRFASVTIPHRSFFHLELPSFGKRTSSMYLDRLNDTVNGHPAFYYTSDYGRIFDTIRLNAAFDNEDRGKVYFSRRKLKRKKEIGEFALERIFVKNGFSVYYPEQMRVSEQINIIRNCTYFASVEGTLAHNIVFASVKTKQVVLRKQSEIIPRQDMINQAVGVPVTYVKCFLEPFYHFPLSHSAGPFWLAAGKDLKKFCDGEGFVFVRTAFYEHACNFIIYTCNCLYVGFKRVCKSLLSK